MRASSIKGNKENKWKSRTFTDSVVFTPDVSGTALVYVCGGGGSGACVELVGYLCLGGGAGGMAIKKVDLVAGTAYTITIGAGGPLAIPNTNGTAGGNSSFVGGGYNMVGNGGAGGTTHFNTSIATPGAVGGTASGGDWNNTGGDGGGNLSGMGGTYTQGTGGGAVGLYGDGYNGGDIAGVGYEGTGGAGTGGASTGTGGGGTGGPGVASTVGKDSGGWWHNSLIDFSAKGGVPASASIEFDQIIAGVTGGNYQTTSGLKAGPLCGGGGLGCIQAASHYASSGYYGGGGGGASKNNTTGTTYSGAGGDGFVHIVLEDVK